jgi:hypothetical protein
MYRKFEYGKFEFDFGKTNDEANNLLEYSKCYFINTVISPRLPFIAFKHRAEMVKGKIEK